MIWTTRHCYSQCIRQRGSAAVEFALLLIPMLLLAFGVTEFGRAIYHYNTLLKSVRASARLLSHENPDSDRYVTLQDQARCLAVYGNVQCSGQSLAPDLDKSHIKICDRKSWSDCKDAIQGSYRNVPTGEGTMQLVAVRIDDYVFSFIGLPLVTAGPTITFGPIEAVMRQAE